MVPVEQVLDLHRNFDRFFDQLWRELPTQTSPDGHTGLHVQSADGAWKVSVPMPGIDPKHVTLDVSGNNLSIRAEQPESSVKPRRIHIETTGAEPAQLHAVAS